MIQQGKLARDMPPLGALLLGALIALSGLYTSLFSLWTALREGFFADERLSMASRIDTAVVSFSSVAEVLVGFAILLGVRRAIRTAIWLESGVAVVIVLHGFFGNERGLALGLGAGHAVLSCLLALVARHARRGTHSLRPWRIVALVFEVLASGLLVSEGIRLWTNAIADRESWPKRGVLAAAAMLPREPFDVVLTATDGSSRPAWKAGPRVTLVNYWATWCVPCVKELPDLEAVASAHDGSQLAVVLIETSQARPSQVRDVLATRAPHLTCLQDADGRSWPLVANALGRSAIPTSILLDSLGQPIARWQGARSASEMEHEITAVLARDHHESALPEEGSADASQGPEDGR